MMKLVLKKLNNFFLCPWGKKEDGLDKHDSNLDSQIKFYIT